MHDAVSAERLGIPAAAIITDHMASAAQAMAAILGLSGYPFAVIGHPISNNTDAELRAKAEEALHQCIKVLTER